MTQHAESDRPFPPPMITRWVQFNTVSREGLVAELRYWADHMERWLEEDRHSG